MNSADKEGNSPLHLAAKSDSSEVITMLVSLGADLEAKNQLGESPLYVAVSYGSEAAIRSLLKAGANLATKAADGKGLMHAAVRSSRPDLLRLLKEAENHRLAADKNPNAPSSPKPDERVITSTPTDCNVSQDKNIICETIQNKNAIISRRSLVSVHSNPPEIHNKSASDRRQSMQQRTSSRQHDISLNILNESSSKENKSGTSKEGDDIKEKCQGRKVSKWENIYSRADKFNDQSDEEDFPCEVLNKKALKDMENVLERMRMFWNSVCTYVPVETKIGQNYPLHEAAISSAEEAVRVLISRGANVNAQGDSRRTPIMYAVLGGSVNIIEILVKAGADYKMTNVDGSTLLHVAAMFDRLPALKKLVSLGLDPNMMDDNGCTPLDIAAHSSPAIEKELLKHGAYRNKIDLTGLPPIDIALARDFIEQIVSYNYF